MCGKSLCIKSKPHQLVKHKKTLSKIKLICDFKCGVKRHNSNNFFWKSNLILIARHLTLKFNFYNNLA